MEASATNTASTTTTTAAAEQMKKKLGMDKDDFLKLFVTQLQHQDPLAPQDASAMLQQLSQLTQVEQAYNTTATLEKLLTSQNSSLAMGAVSLIGKQVTADSDQIGFNGSESTTASYQTATTLTGAKLAITNSSGQVVRTIDLGTVNPGTSTYQWDGKDDQGNLQPAGTYTFAVNGTNPLGKQQQAATATTGKADGVSFLNGVAYVSMGPVVIPFSTVVSVKES
ncbi:flagellar hook assembly protein FlgD [Trichlorobacter ammonificans]|uniref:Basal-body rod modification protein FlgD n=1 Tax=Trichlorobacter ammonificans TaxID=2916410 RepID=A0ABM9D6G0_9BACT|nr:FlgD immunoglobulin-like domain containing protein [Trichlorobacter ammonificans]CAH2029993.1 Flagellar basal-body rod modification protein FlgD [Trichlorobacter ammonificans]